MGTEDELFVGVKHLFYDKHKYFPDLNHFVRFSSKRFTEG